jgi:hypothetical protein
MVNVSAKNRWSISVSRRYAERRSSNIPIPAKSALASPIRQARSVSAALACFGLAVALDYWESEPEAA